MICVNLDVRLFEVVTMALTGNENIRRIVETIILDEVSCDDDVNLARSVVNCTSSTAKTSAVVAVCCQVHAQRKRPRRVEDFVDVTVPAYSEVEFKSHFRMWRSTTEVMSVSKLVSVGIVALFVIII